MALASALMSAVILFLGVITFIIILFLPSIMKPKKPRDANSKVSEKGKQYGVDLLLNMEFDAKFDWATVKIVAEIIAFLPSLEP